MNETKYHSVNTEPVKRFFVEMLTRDIAVEDAILDLLDNCVDGILRRQPDSSDKDTPYKGFQAKITADADHFEISDNCGGIPWSESERAFRMGRPATAFDSTEGTPTLSVGVYGIGMKRAIFKIGREASISTQSGADRYEVSISGDWMQKEGEWDLPVKPIVEKMGSDGTDISLTRLNKDVSERFAAERFRDNLIDKIESNYAVILRKGFEVSVNGIAAKPKPLDFRFSPLEGNNTIRPYVFTADFDDVNIFLAVGLREPIPDVESVLAEQEGPQFSSEYAGWTVICNDRVVLFCNRDELTGWGTGGVPRYHTQFIAISGVVEFRGDPSKLPTTTTKRGLDFSASIYQQVLNRMRDGTRLFVDYTNKWKMHEEEAKSQVSPVPSVPFYALKQEVEKLNMTQVRAGIAGEQYKPKLPLPASNRTDVRISYYQQRADAIELGGVLLDDFDDIKDKDIPRRVGEASFEYAYSKLVKES